MVKKRKGKKPKEVPEAIDELTPLDGATLEKTMAALKEKLQDAKIRRNLVQFEKDLIHDFYNNTRTDIKDSEAEIKNFDTSMQEMENGHRIEIKTYI